MRHPAKLFNILGYTKQTKKTLFANFGSYLRDCHCTTNGYQNITFFWQSRNLEEVKKGSSFHKFSLQKSFYKWNNENTKNYKIVLLAGRLS